MKFLWEKIMLEHVARHFVLKFFFFSFLWALHCCSWLKLQKKILCSSGDSIENDYDKKKKRQSWCKWVKMNEIVYCMCGSKRRSLIDTKSESEGRKKTEKRKEN